MNKIWECTTKLFFSPQSLYSTQCYFNLTNFNMMIKNAPITKNSEEFILWVKNSQNWLRGKTSVAFKHMQCQLINLDVKKYNDICQLNMNSDVKFCKIAYV